MMKQRQLEAREWIENQEEERVSNVHDSAQESIDQAGTK